MAEPSSILLGSLPPRTKIVFKEGLSFVAVEPNGALKLITPVGIMPLSLETLSEEAQAAVASAKKQEGGEVREFPDMDFRPGKLTYVSSSFEVDPVAKYANAVMDAAARIGATAADIPGLWNAPGYPELTSGQLLDIARQL